MEEIRPMVLSPRNPNKTDNKSYKAKLYLSELMENYCKTMGHKYPDHQCSKCYGEDNIIQCQYGIRDSRAR
ncbi:hypothetical protein H5410_064419 [Solanum commersonii]|uniref:Uncharacterized protein n=1 Tax=Solanum commersonii TaxID=4109 RepID=A0A9J5VZJ8_SOLCO|nr:hypothetical protein H5410_064419 [Solanum commersonii]